MYKHIPFWDICQQLFTFSSMQKSIYTREQERLQAVLRQIRLEAGLRQADVAKRLGQPQSFVSKYESGQRRLDLVELRQVCQAVGVPLEQFVKRFEARLG